MTYVATPDKAFGDVLTETVWDGVVSSVNSGVLRPLANTTLGAPASVISFSGIPPTFLHMLLVVTARSSLAGTFDNARLSFNGDNAGTNYDVQYLSQGATGTAAETYAGPSFLLAGFPASGSPAGRFGSVEMWIPNYALAFQKSVVYTNPRLRSDTATDLAVQYGAGWWRSTDAIVSVALAAVSGSFVAGSRATLYGLGGM